MGTGLNGRGVLLDTHALLWWVLDAPRLTRPAFQAIADPHARVYVSAASAWEIATKHRLRKLVAGPLAADFVAAVQAERFEVLDITAQQAQRAGALVGTHGDPFDRMLMAQSLLTGMPLVSNETVFDQYGIVRVW